MCTQPHERGIAQTHKGLHHSLIKCSPSVQKSRQGRTAGYRTEQRGGLRPRGGSCSNKYTDTHFCTSTDPPARTTDKHTISIWHTLHAWTTHTTSYTDVHKHACRPPSPIWNQSTQTEISQTHAHTPPPIFMLILLVNMSRPPSPWGRSRVGCLFLSFSILPLFLPNTFLAIFPPIRDPHTHLSWHWCTHMHKHTYGTHISLCPNPCTIPPHPQPLLPSVPPVGCQQLAEAVAMETGPICTLSPWHPPLQEHGDRERERENKKMQESEIGEWVRRYKSETEGDKKKKEKKQNTKGEKQRTCTKNGFCSQSITQSHYFYGLLMASYLLTHSLICWLKMNADWKRVDWARLPRAKMKVDLICSWTLLKSTGLGKYKRIQQCLFSCVFVVARTVVFISTSPFLPLKWKTVRKSCPHCILSQ